MADSMNAISRFLVRKHQLYSFIIPSFYYPYRFQGGKIFLNVKESRMMMRRALKCYEIEKHLAIRKFLPSGGTFVDVGVNKGDFSLLAASISGPSGTVIAFEPEPDNCKWILKSIELNGYDNISLNQIALSDSNGTADFFIGEKSGFHSLLKSHQQVKGGEKFTVNTQTLDHYLASSEGSNPVNIIKIDVEGAEMSVLRGAVDTIDANKDIVLLVDIHPTMGVDPLEVCTFLTDRGFGIFHEKAPFDIPVTDYSDLRQIVAKR